nr:MAG TPA: hypothetical protein [Caudoviricetes sp.]DAY11002.1 MAG TPA: hypothetical protein [Caudoviricetes sp.]
MNLYSGLAPDCFLLYIYVVFISYGYADGLATICRFI